MKLEYNKGILFVRLYKKLDHDLSREINQFLVPKVLEQKIKYIVVNFFNVDYVDHFGLDALLNLKCAIKSNKGKICLCEISDELESKIKECKFKKVNNEINALDKIGAI